MPLTIESFREKRRAELIELWRRAGLTVPWNDPDRDIDAKLAFQPELLLIALEENRLVGTVMVGYEGHRGWIQYLGVDPDHRRRGIGGRLLAAAEEKLRVLGCPKINLMVRAGNAEVVRFYERQGFAVEDRVCMGRRLDDGKE